ncbi:DUF805 domain-containing protein [Flagellimonas onchidii]|uniref:DUF805 domain-containing protein n=1 Tax=Flagellimonas onchidii TaxID=2562684 RepID=UPI0010A66452|nr:DUF805 domain-containing protein [Allomuricauda onchidii]
MKWYIKVLKQYADFKGRARRTEFWMFVLFNTIFAVALSYLDYLFDMEIGHTQLGILYVTYVLVTFIPGLAVSVRRLHDIGKSGWMLFIALIPIVGPIWLIVLYVTEGNSGNNPYGSDPKEQ